MGNNYKIKNVIEKLDENGTAHHIFNYHEVRAKLVSLFGEPKTDQEHVLLSKRCKNVMDNMPVFILNADFHAEYEMKLRGAIKGDSRLVSILNAKLSKTRSTYQKKVNNLKKEIELIKLKNKREE